MGVRLSLTVDDSHTSSSSRFFSLDVTEPEPLPEGHPLYTHPKVFLTPHTCAISPQVRQAVFAKFMRSLKAWENGGLPEDPVDLDRGY